MTDTTPVRTDYTDDELGEMSLEQLQAWSEQAFDHEHPIEVDPGPPLDPTRRSHSLSIRFTAAELDELRGLADEAGLSVGAYVRGAALSSDGTVGTLQTVRRDLEHAADLLQRLAG